MGGLFARFPSQFPPSTPATLSPRRPVLQPAALFTSQGPEHLTKMTHSSWSFTDETQKLEGKKPPARSQCWNTLELVFREEKAQSYQLCTLSSSCVKKTQESSAMVAPVPPRDVGSWVKNLNLKSDSTPQHDWEASLGYMRQGRLRQGFREVRVVIVFPTFNCRIHMVM